MVTEKEIINNDQKVLNQGFTTTPNLNANIVEVDEIKSYYDSFEQAYRFLTENIDLSDLSQIDKMNKLTSMISKLRTAYAIYENIQELKKKNVALPFEESDVKNNFFQIYNECVEEYNRTNGKTL